MQTTNETLVHVDGVCLYLQKRYRRVHAREMGFGVLSFLVLVGMSGVIVGILAGEDFERLRWPFLAVVGLSILISSAERNIAGPSAKQLLHLLKQFREIRVAFSHPRPPLKGKDGQPLTTDMAQTRLAVVEDLWASLEPLRDTRLWRRCKDEAASSR